MIYVAKDNLMQLADLLEQIDKEDYTAKPSVLYGANIGQHIRHILEFYLILLSGSFSGIITYDKRKRDFRIESDPQFANKTIKQILLGIETLDLGALVKVEADFSAKGLVNNLIHSSVSRELAYCIEHSIHHQALIKAGLKEIGKEQLTDEHFGIAYSTIRYRNKKCAQ